MGNQVSSHTHLVLYKQEFNVSVLPLTTFKDIITLPSDNTKQRSVSDPPETHSQTLLVFFFFQGRKFSLWHNLYEINERRKTVTIVVHWIIFSFDYE